jgi:acyl-CoA thioester hydrolase
MSPTEGVHHTGIEVRFADTDALGHVNATSFAQYAEAGRLAFLGQLGQGPESIILAHLAIEFRSQVRFGEALRVETRVERLGRTSVTLRQAVLAGQRLAAEMRSVVVVFDYERQRPREMPPALREGLARYASSLDHPGTPS